MIALPFLIGLTCQKTTIDWHPKGIQIPRDLKVIRFPIALPSKAAGFTIQSALLVWVPKVDIYPGHPARQALRVTLVSKERKIVELFETPSSGLEASPNIGQIIGQGYLDFPLSIGMTIVSFNRGKTAIGLVSKDFDAIELHKIGKQLSFTKAR